MEFLLALLVLLGLARLLGEAGERVGIPALVGELAAGIILGPALLGWIAPTDSLALLANLGIFFLVYLAGMELTIRDVKRSLRGSATVVAMASFVAPFAIGVMVASFFGFAFSTALFVGIALGLTALPVSIRVLTYFGKLDTEWGRTIVTAGLLCDIAGLAIVGLLNTWIRAGYVFDPQTVLLMSVKLGLFAAAIVATEKVLRLHDGAVARWLLRNSQRFISKGASFALPFVGALGYAFLAEALGLHFVLGAFFGTLLLSEHLLRKQEAKQVHDATALVTTGLFAPLFFAFIGLNFAPPSLSNVLLLGALLIAALVGKLLGGYIGAALARFDGWDRWAIGFGMNGRGAMELVVATIGLEAGILDAGLFSILVVIGVVTTVMTPIALKQIIRAQQASGAGGDVVAGPSPRSRRVSTDRAAPRRPPA